MRLWGPRFVLVASSYSAQGFCMGILSGRAICQYACSEVVGHTISYGDSQSCSTTFLYEHFGGSSNCQTLFFRLCCPQFVLMASNWVAESSRMGNSPNRAICPYVVVRLWGPRFVLVAFSAIRLIALKALSSCPFPASDYEHTRYKPNDNKRRRLLVFG